MRVGAFDPTVQERGYQKVVIYHKTQLGRECEEAEWYIGWVKPGGRF